MLELYQDSLADLLLPPLPKGREAPRLDIKKDVKARVYGWGLGWGVWGLLGGRGGLRRGFEGSGGDFRGFRAWFWGFEVCCLGGRRESEPLLTRPPPSSPAPKTTEQGIVTVAGATQVDVTSAKQLLAAIESGQQRRHTSSTLMNQDSSRSHLVISVLIEATNLQTQAVSRGKLSFVDLAGSERCGRALGAFGVVEPGGGGRGGVGPGAEGRWEGAAHAFAPPFRASSLLAHPSLTHPNPRTPLLNRRSVKKSGSAGEALKEAQAINKSLSALGDVISALATDQQHIPYRRVRPVAPPSLPTPPTHGWPLARAQPGVRTALLRGRSTPLSRANPR